MTPERLASQSTGLIEGRVQLEEPPPPRRSANRYRGGASAAHTIQAIPAVAYLVGPVAGSSARPAPTMTQRDTTFNPSVVFVRTGGSVSFPNEDPFQHNVFSFSSAMRFNLGRQNPGTSEARTFGDPGIVEVFCEVHDFMRGAIIVTENSYYAVIASDGSFTIDGVPAGEHTIAFWSPEHEPVRQTVAVVSGETTTLQVQLRR